MFSCLYRPHQGPSYSPLDDENATEMEAVPFIKADSGNADGANNRDDDDDDGDDGKKASRPSSAPAPPKKAAPPVLPLRRMWTRNFVLMLLVSALHDGHLGAYATLWVSFLSDPAPASPGAVRDALPFRFSGGVGMTPSEIGVTLSIVGACGLPIQFFVYPHVTHRLGALRAWRLFMRGFPVLYVVAPFLAVLSRRTHDAATAGELGQPLAVWVLIVMIQVTLVLCAVFVTPSQLMLIRLWVLFFFSFSRSSPLLHLPQAPSPTTLHPVMPESLPQMSSVLQRVPPPVGPGADQQHFVCGQRRQPCHRVGLWGSGVQLWDVARLHGPGLLAGRSRERGRVLSGHDVQGRQRPRDLAGRG